MLKNSNDKIIAVALLCAVLLSLFWGIGSASALGEAAVSSRAAALYEPRSGTFVYEKNSDERLPMASTTKIMTALVAIERENLEKKITVDSRAIGIEGSSAYLKRGEVMTLRELLYALMLQSANDAAEAIAYALSGSIEAFAELMNGKAVALGLTDTHFTNPHGLDDEEHYTSAHDLAIITAEALEYPEFREIVSTRTKRVEKSDISRLFVNHNKLLTRYEGCIGVKTGFTKKSGRCLVSAAERGGITMIYVTINSPDDWNEHERMLDYGFNTMENTVLVSRKDFNYSLPVIGADTERIKLGIAEDVSVLRRRNSEEPIVEILLPRFLTAPIKQGDAVGKIVVKDGENILLERDVIATESISAKKEKGLFGLKK